MKSKNSLFYNALLFVIICGINACNGSSGNSSTTAASPSNLSLTVLIDPKMVNFPEKKYSFQLLNNKQEAYTSSQAKCIINNCFIDFAVPQTKLANFYRLETYANQYFIGYSAVKNYPNAVNLEIAYVDQSTSGYILAYNLAKQQSVLIESVLTQFAANMNLSTSDKNIIYAVIPLAIGNYVANGKFKTPAAAMNSLTELLNNKQPLSSNSSTKSLKTNNIIDLNPLNLVQNACTVLVKSVPIVNTVSSVLMPFGCKINPYVGIYQDLNTLIAQNEQMLTELNQIESTLNSGYTLSQANSISVNTNILNNYASNINSVYAQIITAMANQGGNYQLWESANDVTVFLSSLNESSLMAIEKSFNPVAMQSFNQSLAMILPQAQTAPQPFSNSALYTLFEVPLTNNMIYSLNNTQPIDDNFWTLANEMNQAYATQISTSTIAAQEALIVYAINFELQQLDNNFQASYLNLTQNNYSTAITSAIESYEENSQWFPTNSLQYVGLPGSVSSESNAAINSINGLSSWGQTSYLPFNNENYISQCIIYDWNQTSSNTAKPVSGTMSYQCKQTNGSYAVSSFITYSITTPLNSGDYLQDLNGVLIFNDTTNPVNDVVPAASSHCMSSENCYFTSPKHQITYYPDNFTVSELASSSNNLNFSVDGSSMWDGGSKNNYVTMIKDNTNGNIFELVSAKLDDTDEYYNVVYLQCPSFYSNSSSITSCQNHQPLNSSDGLNNGPWVSASQYVTINGSMYWLETNQGQQLQRNQGGGGSYVTTLWINKQ